MQHLKISEIVGDIARGTALLKENSVNKEIKARLTALFIESAPALLEDFEKFKSDPIGTRKTAHALKGAAGFVGAARVWALASEFESRADKLSADEAQLFVAAIRKAFEETRQVFFKD